MWCFDTRVSQRNTPATKEDVGHYLQDLAVTLQLDELLLAQPELLFEGDLPTDHLFRGTERDRNAPSRQKRVSPQTPPFLRKLRLAHTRQKLPLHTPGYPRATEAP